MPRGAMLCPRVAVSTLESRARRKQVAKRDRARAVGKGGPGAHARGELGARRLADLDALERGGALHGCAKDLAIGAVGFVEQVIFEPLAVSEESVEICVGKFGQLAEGLANASIPIDDGSIAIKCDSPDLPVAKI